MELCLSAIAGYLIGSINPSYLFSRRKGMDIRENGTGNAGATNTMFVLGFRTGILVMILDILKAFVAVFTTRQLVSPLAASVVGLSCTLGHVFPVFLHFRGGKGTACLGGTILGLSPILFLPMVLGVFVLGVIFNRASILPLIGSAAYPGIYYLYTGYLPAALVLIGLFLLLLWSHRGNFAKFRNGEESSFRKVMFGRNLDDCVERNPTAKK